MSRATSGKRTDVHLLADELMSLMQRDAFIRRLAAAAVGAGDAWRALVAPVWLRIQNSSIDFLALEGEQRSRFLKQQVRWALKDFIRAGGEASSVPPVRRSAVEPIDLPHPSATSETQWASLEDGQLLEAIVQCTWQALPPFERGVLALYAGQPCEFDATVQLAARVGLAAGELIRRTRSADVLRETPTGDGAATRGGRRGRQRALAEALGVSPGCIHQWTCRARNLFRRELRARSRALDRTMLPPILERLLG